MKKLHIPLHLHVRLALYFVFIFCAAASKAQRTVWQTVPFQFDFFIENKGQYSQDILDETSAPVLYVADFGKVKAYFTAKGPVYRLEQLPELKHEEEEENPSEEEKAKEELEFELEQRRRKNTYRFFSCEWKDADPAVKIEASLPSGADFTFASGTQNTFRAKGFKKITYKGLYPGIDVEYIFPEGKTGLKYNLIVHPGADLSRAKLLYSGARKMWLTGAGEIVTKSRLGTFTDHAISAWYAHNASPVKISYELSGKEISFRAAEPLEEKTIIIDPWTTNPNIVNVGWGSGTNAAYDVDYDNYGNVYAYGSYWPFKLVKLNSSGTILWTFIVPGGAGFSQNYGDFAVDRVTGTCYLTEGVGTGTGGAAKVLKVNTAGNLVGTFGGNSNIYELWRVAYDNCNHQLIAVGGGMPPVIYQACTIDTGMILSNTVNVLGATQGFHDLSFLALDPNGTECFMASTKSNVYSGHNNVLMRVPVAGLSPAAYQVWDGYNVREGYMNGYVLGTSSIGSPNSFSNAINGMACNSNYLYMSDGTNLTRYNKSTGAILSVVTMYMGWTHPLSKDSIRWCGIDVDECDNIYVGVKNTAMLYNASLTLAQTINLADTVYDLKLGQNQLLYACGKAYVSAISITTGNAVSLSTSSTPVSCGCDGTATATLTTTCPGTATVTYSWSTNPVQYGSAATGLCPGTYTVTASLGCARVYSDTVNIAPAPGALTYSAAVTHAACSVSNNGSITISASGGQAPYTYAWSNGATTPGVTGLAAGTYTCVLSDAGGCTDTIIETVNQSSPVIATALLSAMSCTGNAAATASVSGGTAPYTYAWSSGGNAATENNLAAGTYTCTVTDVNGCTDTAVVTVTLPSPVIASVTVNNVACFGGNSGSAAVSASGAAPFTYSWSPAVSVTANANNLAAGTYSCIVTDDNGCADTVTAVIAQNPAIALNITSVNVSCYGAADGSAAVTASGGSGTFSYSWQPSGGTAAAAVNLAAGTYTCFVTDGAGCVSNTSSIITQPPALQVNAVTAPVTCSGGSDGSASVAPSGGNGPFAFSWQPAGGSGAAANNLSAGVYTCTVTDAQGCATPVTVTVSEPLPVAVFVSDDTICFGQSYVLVGNASGGTAPYSYSWNSGVSVQQTYSVSPSSTSSYSLVATDANGCPSPVTAATLVVLPPLQVTVNDISVCPGGSDTLTAVVSGGNGNYTVTWQPGGMTGSSLVVSPSVSTTYLAVVSDGCTVGNPADTAAVNVLPAPDVTLVISSQSGCAPVCVAFEAVFSPATAGNVQWNFGDGDSSSLATPYHCYFSPGTYNVGISFTTAEGCNASVAQTGMITVWPVPDAGFTASPFVTDIYDPHVEFTDQSSGGNYWNWNFGDGSASTLQHPQHDFTEPGTYSVMQAVTNAYGCTDTALHAITINDVYTFYAPNAFTPDDDNGVNENFVPRGVGWNRSTFNMWIFNRWGEEIFHGTDADFGWDGKYKGKLVQMDVYVWRVNLKDIFGKDHAYTGKVSVVK